MEYGRSISLLNEAVFQHCREKQKCISRETIRLKTVRVKPSAINAGLAALGTAPVREDITLEQLLRRPEVTYDFILRYAPPPVPLPAEARSELEIQIKYNGYILRQTEMADKLKKMEGKRIPERFEYSSLSGLSNEIVSKLNEVRPESIGQASRIPGVTPAAVSLILIAIEKRKRQQA